jgi:uncharacterized protein with FMN-binding domain
MQDPRQRKQPQKVVLPEVKPKAAPKAAQGKTSHRKVAGSLIALSTAAVVSVYTVGYMNTRASTDQLAAVAANTTVATQSSTSPRTSATSPQTSTAPKSSAPTPAQSTGSSANTQSAYRDGTYTGAGNSRHGGIQVSVVISGGKIASAKITNCGTRYSCSYVEPLLQLVIDRQAVPVEHVSGATDSSNAFKGAISSALQKALSGA